MQKRIRLLYKKAKRVWRKLPRRKRQTLGLIAASCIIFIIVLQGTRPMIDASAYQPLLDTIAKGESNGNYNAYFGRTTNDVPFTRMTVAEVMQWQEEYIRQGSASNAVGRYQFISTTLAGLVKQLNINPRATFSPTLQDRLARALIDRRGSHAFVQNKITREEFAASLAQEWAALPRLSGDNPHESYYAGDGLNQARVSADDVLQAVDQLKSK